MKFRSRITIGALAAAVTGGAGAFAAQGLNRSDSIEEGAVPAQQSADIKAGQEMEVSVTDETGVKTVSEEPEGLIRTDKGEVSWTSDRNTGQSSTQIERSVETPESSSSSSITSNTSIEIREQHTGSTEKSKVKNKVEIEEDKGEIRYESSQKGGTNSSTSIDIKIKGNTGW